MSFCGLDFGTSNSTLGIKTTQGIHLTQLEGDSPILPSAIFFDFETDTISYGRAAINNYINGQEGRLMRAIKTILSSNLIEEKTALASRSITFKQVIALLLRHLKTTAERNLGQSLDTVVHGRPVHFIDGNPTADQRAQDILAEIAHQVGFREISFQLEPIAAARSYELQVNQEEIALVADIGGGTSDFSLVKIGPHLRQRTERHHDILANAGVRFGGTDFDQALSLKTVMPLLGYGSSLRQHNLKVPKHYYHDLSTWSKINFLYTHKELSAITQIRHQALEPNKLDRLLTVIKKRLGHSLMFEVEKGKIALSDATKASIDLSLVESDLRLEITQQQLAEAIRANSQCIADQVHICLKQANMAADQVNTVFLTGGSTLLPVIRQAILSQLPQARPVEGDKFGAVGLGLALEAAARYQ